VFGAAAQPLGLAGHRAGADTHAGEDNRGKREARASLSKKREERGWEKGNDPNRVSHPFYTPPSRFGFPLDPTQDPDRTGPPTRAQFVCFFTALHPLSTTTPTRLFTFRTFLFTFYSAAFYHFNLHLHILFCR